jgi:hypothetical protein
MAPLGYQNNAYALEDGTIVGKYMYEIVDENYVVDFETLNPDFDPLLTESKTGQIIPAFFEFGTATNMRILVAALYLVAAVMQFVGLALVYNLDKKTLAKMQEELDARHAPQESNEDIVKEETVEAAA